MFNNIRLYIAKKLAAQYFQDQITAVGLERINKISSLTEADLVREKLAGFNPRLMDGLGNSKFDMDEGILTYVEKSPEIGLTDFLADCHTLAGNRALPLILDWLVRKQILFSAKMAPDLNSINFGRASINGCELVREEVARLDAAYEERKKPKVEDDDPHAGIPPL